jgi:tetratricopeptide (TPR) repeat protein
MTQNDYQLQKAIEFEESGNYLHAIQIYQSLLDDQIYGRNSTLRLVGIYEKLNKIEPAVKVLDKYLSNSPLDYDFIKYFGHFLISHSYNQKALQILNEFDFESKPEAYFLAGIAYFGLEDYENSKLNFLQLLAYSEKTELFVDTYLFLAKINLKLNNIDDAHEVLGKIRKSKTSNFEFYLIDAQIHFSKGMFFHAYELIREAEKLSKDNPEVAMWAGKILLKMDEYSKAESYLLRYVKTQPSSEAYSMLGWACLKNRKIKDAETYFGKALNIEPENQSALEGKSKLVTG